jgi:hypothetical protein
MFQTHAGRSALNSVAAACKGEAAFAKHCNASALPAGGPHSQDNNKVLEAYVAAAIGRKLAASTI